MIIKDLLKSGICFSVMKSFSKLKTTSSYSSPEYEIIALMSDFKELEEYGFETNQNTSECPVNWLNPDGIISRILEGSEIDEFQKYIDEFKEVYRHSKNGKVFELKKMSFKKIYNQQK